MNRSRQQIATGSIGNTFHTETGLGLRRENELAPAWDRYSELSGYDLRLAMPQNFSSFHELRTLKTQLGSRSRHLRNRPRLLAVAAVATTTGILCCCMDDSSVEPIPALAPRTLRTPAPATNRAPPNRLRLTSDIEKSSPVFLEHRCGEGR
jgi:hypothetical protein